MPPGCACTRHQRNQAPRRALKRVTLAEGPQLHFHEDSWKPNRPVWMPHPGLIAFIALLWALAGVAQVVPSV